MNFNRIYVTPLDCYIEFGYGLWVIRATRNDNILSFFNSAADVFSWLQSRLTDDEKEELVKTIEALNETRFFGSEVIN